MEPPKPPPSQDHSEIDGALEEKMNPKQKKQNKEFTTCQNIKYQLNVIDILLNEIKKIYPTIYKALEKHECNNCADRRNQLQSQILNMRDINSKVENITTRYDEIAIKKGNLWPFQVVKINYVLKHLPEVFNDLHMSFKKIHETLDSFNGRGENFDSVEPYLPDWYQLSNSLASDCYRIHCDIKETMIKVKILYNILNIQKVPAKILRTQKSLQGFSIKDYYQEVGKNKRKSFSADDIYKLKKTIEKK